MIVYIGNMLSIHGRSFTFTEAIVPLLRETKYDVIAASNKKNQLVRLVHMLFTIFKHRNKAQLVILAAFSSSAWWYTYLSAAVCKLFKLPYFVVLHGGAFPVRLESSPKMCKYVFNDSVYNIAPSKYLYDAFVEKGYKVKYIPNFIHLKNYDFKLRENIRPRILWVRGFHKVYRPLDPLKIVQALEKKYDDVELCMVGGDSDGSIKDVKAYIKNNKLENKVKVTGRLPKTEWIELSKKYDIFINTTSVDNHPVSVTEAMALGFPCISTDVGGIPNLIEHEKDGILVKTGAIDEFVSSIELLINKPEMTNKISTNARKKVEGYDWETSAKDKWIELIDDVVQ